jgi:hypothetical protein
MPQLETAGPLDESVGYLLKQAATALRSRIDAKLRPLGLSVPQYACGSMPCKLYQILSLLDKVG